MAKAKKTFSGYVSPITTKSGEISSSTENQFIDQPNVNVPKDTLHLVESDDNVYKPIVFSEAQRQRRDELVNRVKNGLEAFIDVALALIALQEERLYLETHTTFEAYCSDVFNLKRRRAYQFIEAGKNVLELLSDPDNQPKILPRLESHSTALSDVPDGRKLEVWNAAIDEAELTGKQISAKHVKAVSERVLGKSPRINKGSSNKKSGPKQDDDEFSDHQAQLTAEVLQKSQQNGYSSADDQVVSSDLESYEDNVDWSKALTKVESEMEPENTDDQLTEESQKDSLAQSISTVRGAIRSTEDDDVLLVITGKFLKKERLAADWFRIRGTQPPPTLDDEFVDTLSFPQARALGIL